MTKEISAPSKIHRLSFIPSSAYGIKKNQLKYYVRRPDYTLKHGDVVYGEIERIGHHQSIESKIGRIHKIYSGDRGVFVVGNRYAPDYYEARIPEDSVQNVDLIARSGVVARMISKNNKVKDPTLVKILGHVCNREGQALNTVDYPSVVPRQTTKAPKRAKMIVFVGTSMNSGKSFAAAATVKALTSLGHTVRASKITGTASLKDIMNMSDAGAEKVADFTYVGHPSTYMLDKQEVINIFNNLDLKYANRAQNYWVVEVADGILQRETAMLMSSSEFKSRIHKIVFCAGDALGALSGKRLMKDKYGINVDMLSGVFTAAPLHIDELKGFTHLPVLNSAKPDLKQVADILE